MEFCVESNITNHLVTQNLLEDGQWANMKGKSTEQLLKQLTERWREAIERKLFEGILSHNIVLRKLNDLGIRRDIWLWLKNHLTERRQFVRINGCDSDTHIITHGVPQGTVLGPTLFSLFTNDLPKSLRSAETYLMQTTNNILYRRNDGFANKHTRKCSSSTLGMVRQKFDGTTPRKM